MSLEYIAIYIASRYMIQDTAITVISRKHFVLHCPDAAVFYGTQIQTLEAALKVHENIDRIYKRIIELKRHM